MDRPKWLKFIVISGIAVSLVGFAIALLTAVISSGLTLGSILFLCVPTMIIIILCLKLYHLKNWARDIIILFSAFGLIPIFNIRIGAWFTAYGLFVIPFYLFYLIYLMKRDVRAYFTDKKRSILKIITACIAIALALIISVGLSFLGSLIDFEKGKFTEKGKILFKPLFKQASEKYEINRQNAENLLKISFSKEYQVTMFQEYPEFSLTGFLVREKNAKIADDDIWAWMSESEEYIIVIEFQNKRDIDLQEASAFLFEEETIKKVPWFKRIKLGDVGIVQMGSRKIPIVKITYKRSKGMMGVLKTDTHSIIFIAYTYGTDKSKELNTHYLQEALKLFD